MSYNSGMAVDKAAPEIQLKTQEKLMRKMLVKIEGEKKGKSNQFGRIRCSYDD